jgi:antitoxin component YwqK of YwqJK toxin-antitoxin module
MDRFSWAFILHLAITTGVVNALPPKTLGQAQKPRQEQILLKPRHPEWTNVIVSSYPSGQLAKIRFFEDDVAVKEISYYENGQISEEADLIEIDHKPVYHGVKVQIDREGHLHSVVHFSEGKPHGKMRVLYPNGSLRAEGEYKNGLEEGAFIQYFEDGSKLEESTFVLGKREGETIQYYPSGRKAKTIHWKNGKREGKETSWYENGVIASVLNFVEDLLENDASNPAVVIYHEQKGIKEIQEFQKGVPTNSHIQYHPNGKERQRIFFKDGKIHGQITTRSSDGKVVGEAQFKEGVPYGRHFLKHENGQIAFVADYDDKGEVDGFIHEYTDAGQLVGKYRRSQNVFKEYFENGKLRTQGFFNEGVKEGRHVEYNEKGEKIADVEFKSDKPHGHWLSWFEGGKPKQDVTYIDGKKNGNCKQYAENGQVILDMVYADDKIVGEYKEFHSNGKTSVTGFYKEGKNDGTFKGYYQDGSLKFHREFLDGKPVGEHKEYFEKIEINGEPTLHRVIRFDSEGVYHGEQRTYHPNGIMASVVNYDAGVLQGLKALFDKEGRKIEEAWYENGKLHGPYLTVDAEGRESVLHYVENKKEGPYIVYHKDGGDGVKMRAVEGYFKNSKIDGELREYNIYGDLVAMTTYKAGKKEGISALYNDQGKVLMTVEYLNDMKEGRLVQYFPSGIIAKKSHYKNDLLEGTHEEFYPTGSLYNRCFYKDGLLDGVSVSYSEEGVKVFEGEYDLGKKSGFFNKYNQDGKIRLEQRFENDVLVFKKSVDEKGKVTEHAL